MNNDWTHDWNNLSLECYDAEVRRRLWRRRLRALEEFAGGVLLVVAVVWLMWAYCRLTPDQLSGEGDWAAHEAATHAQ